MIAEQLMMCNHEQGHLKQQYIRIEGHDGIRRKEHKDIRFFNFY